MAALEAPRRGTVVPLGRRGSFSDVEQFCLRALLLDKPNKPSSQAAEKKKKLDCIDDFQGNYDRKGHPCQKQLDDTVLFQLPFSNNNTAAKRSSQFGRHEKKILGLWQAHSDGVHPIVMHKRRLSGNMSSGRLSASGPPPMDNINIRSASSSRLSNRTPLLAAVGGEEDNGSRASSAFSVKSDVEVRPPQAHDENSSWGEDAPVHYNAWEVLEDEYVLPLCVCVSDVYCCGDLECATEATDSFRLLRYNIKQIRAGLWI